MATKKSVKTVKKAAEWKKVLSTSDSKKASQFQSQCPCCGSTDVYVCDSEMGDDGGSIEYSCSNCDESWTIFYNVVPECMEVKCGSGDDEDEDNDEE